MSLIGAGKIATRLGEAIGSGMKSVGSFFENLGWSKVLKGGALGGAAAVVYTSWRKMLDTVSEATGLTSDQVQTVIFIGIGALVLYLAYRIICKRHGLDPVRISRGPSRGSNAPSRSGGRNRRVHRMDPAGGVPASVIRGSSAPPVLFLHVPYPRIWEGLRIIGSPVPSDPIWSNTGSRMGIVGGNWNNGSKAGVSAFSGNNTLSNSNSNIGARLDCASQVVQAPEILYKVRQTPLPSGTYSSQTLSGGLVASASARPEVSRPLHRRVAS